MVMKKIKIVLILIALMFSISSSFAQSKALVNDSDSPYAKLKSVDMTDVKWTKGFWADRFKVCRDSMLPNLWAIYTDPKMGHATQNFEIAAGLDTGSHVG